MILETIDGRSRIRRIRNEARCFFFDSVAWIRRAFLFVVDDFRSFYFFDLRLIDSRNFAK